MSKLNLTWKEMAEVLNISKSSDIAKQFRELGLVQFIAIGKKFLYKYESIKKLNEKLYNGEVQIKSTDSKYYVTLNKID